MQRITREQARKYAFDWRDEALLLVRPGEAFEIETYDASTGYFKTPEDKAIPAKRPGFDRSPPRANPIGGPVFLEGAERGDVHHRNRRTGAAVALDDAGTPSGSLHRHTHRGTVDCTIRQLESAPDDRRGEHAWTRRPSLND